LRCILGGRQRQMAENFRSLSISKSKSTTTGVWNYSHLVWRCPPYDGEILSIWWATMGLMRKPSRTHPPGRVVGWALPTTTPNRRDARRTSPTTGGGNSSSRDIEQVLVIPTAPIGSDPAGVAHIAGAVRRRDGSRTAPTSCTQEVRHETPWDRSRKSHAETTCDCPGNLPL
jgi:hypothetical protein